MTTVSNSETPPRLTTKSKDPSSLATILATVMITILVVFIAMLGFIYFTEPMANPSNKDAKGSYVTNTRECNYDVDGLTLTGFRHYKTYELRVLGYSVYNPNFTVITTDINSEGRDIVFVGFTAADRSWWRVPSSMGERNLLRLKKADILLVTVNNKTHQVNWQSLCL